MTDSLDDLEERVRWLERAVELLGSVPGAPSLPTKPDRQGAEAAVTAGADVPQSVADHVAAGREIQAVHAYREATGAGLKEAKHAVDALKRQLRS